MIEKGTSQEIQQYVRVLLYTIVGAFIAPELAKHGINLTDATTSAIIGSIMALGTLGWTIYGSRLTALLDRAKSTTGVDSIEVKVDGDLIKPENLTRATSSGIVAKAS